MPAKDWTSTRFMDTCLPTTKALSGFELVQIELTTRCNFNCFYCVGRDMSQADMPYEMFESRLQHHVEKYGVPAQVSLQGEGEPTLHRDFFRMAEHIKALGSQPYTITNGTYKHHERFIGLFSSIGVSIDTMDAREAESIGRFNLPRVLDFVAALKNHLKIIIHSVAVSPATNDVARWCREQQIEHMIQPLQRKADYQYRYAERVASTKTFAGRFNCGYLARPYMRYYTVTGTELPCCFIKDLEQFPGMAAMYAHQRQGTPPKCCSGCRYSGLSARANPIIARSD